MITSLGLHQKNNRAKYYERITFSVQAMKYAVGVLFRFLLFKTIPLVAKEEWLTRRETTSLRVRRKHSVGKKFNDSLSIRVARTQR